MTNGWIIISIATAFLGGLLIGAFLQEDWNANKAGISIIQGRVFTNDCSEGITLLDNEPPTSFTIGVSGENSIDIYTKSRMTAALRNDLRVVSGVEYVFDVGRYTTKVFIGKAFPRDKIALAVASFLVENGWRKE